MSRKLGLLSAPELLQKKYTVRTNVWNFGYVAYLFTSLKFNFQRASADIVAKLAPEFYKVLEKSKIRDSFEGVVFNSIWNMLQPVPEDRASWEEILNDTELAPIIKKIEVNHPGIVQKALLKERLNVKQMISLDQDMTNICRNMQEVYGKYISEEGVLLGPLANLK